MRSRRKGSSTAAIARTVLCFLFSLSVVGTASAARADELVIAPARDGAIGAWLAAGPLFSDPLSPARPDATKLVEAADGAVVRDKVAFHLVTTANGRFDLRSLFRAGDNAFALFGARLRVARASRLLLVLGVDDHVVVLLDGREVYRKEVGRPVLHDDDAVAFDVSPGDHSLLIRLRQREGAWQFRARLLDAADLLPPAQVAFALPGASAEGAAAAMVVADIALEPVADRYRPTVHVHWPGGLPAGAALPVHVEASAAHGTALRALYAVSLGSALATDRGVFDLDAALPDVLASDLGPDEPGGKLVFQVSVGDKRFTIDRPLVPAVRETVGRIDAVLRDRWPALRPKLDDADVVEATLRLYRERLVKFVATGDSDIAATESESRAADAFVEHTEAGRDPIRSSRGPLRLGYRSASDEQIHPFGLYIPADFSPSSDKKYPLVVVLHGLNGLPMQMLRIFFGQDDPAHLAPWEDRHIGAFAPLEAFVVAPSGFGNLSYREAGEVDVMALRDWAARAFPVDPDRIYVTGLSMGGTGTAHVALRYPDSFAAAAPLCGYHSYAFRADMSGRVLRPWEKSLSEYWSTVSWAENASHMPLYVVHGMKDLPVKNSGVLIDRFHALGYSMTDEHPDVGHNVWQQTYEGFKAFRWLDRHPRSAPPRRVEFKTSSLRYADHDWVHVIDLQAQLGWGRVSARVVNNTRIELTTSGVRALRLDPPSTLVDRTVPVTVGIDGESLVFPPAQPIAMYNNGAWAAGSPAPKAGLYKRQGSSGPVTDAFHEPLVFVYGTLDASATRLNREVAETIAHPGFGVETRWPVVADVDVDDALASSHGLFLVGNARSNAYLASIEDKLPLRIDGAEIVAGARRFRGEQLGAMFIHPNPAHPDRYVIVLEGTDVTGVLRALSLPRLLPDFVVYDAGAAGARGQMVFGPARVVAGGMFDASWTLPAEFAAPPSER